MPENAAREDGRAVEAGMGDMDWSGIADYTLTRTGHE
jgi:hypothetical protein